MELILIVSTLPVFFIAWYIYKKDKHKEPLKFLMKLFGFGILIIFPVLIAESIMENIFSNFEDGLVKLFIYMFLGVALIEEFFKWIIVFKVTFKNLLFDSYYDSIVYSVFVSLGFALIENIFYVISYGLEVGFLRAITAVPLHACCALIMGYFLGLAKERIVRNDVKNYKKYIGLSLLSPVLLHTIYNFLALSTVPIFYIIFYIIIVLMYIFFIKKVNKISKDNLGFHVNVYCRNCGNNLSGNFCEKCGFKKEYI